MKNAQPSILSRYALPFLVAFATAGSADTGKPVELRQTPGEDATTQPAAAVAADIQAAPATAEDGPPAATAPQATTETTRLIVGLNAALLDVLRRSDELDYAQRFAVLAPTLESMFDLEYMARQVVGRGFLDLDEGDRVRWYKLFATYMTANYASRFDHFADQRFEILGEEPGAKGTVLVRTKVIDPSRESVALSYRVRETDAGCKVIDVYLKGTVSEIALRRSEYSSVLKREGFDALVTSIEARIDKLAESANSDV